MKIVIAEGGPAGNIGSMALIENAIKIARHKYPNCSITVLSTFPDSVDIALHKDNLHEGVKVLGDIFIIPLSNVFEKIIWMLQNILWLLYTRFLFLFSRNITKFLCGRRKVILKEVYEADYVYCIGAERINDIYYKTALLSLFSIGTFIKMGKKLVHLSMTIGPVFNQSTIFVAKKILNKSYAIFVRDQKSYDILKEWNCKAPFQFKSYDIALLQESLPNKSVLLLKELGIAPGFVAVSVIWWLFRKCEGPSKMPEYNQSLADTLDYIVEKYDKDIVFTPTVIGSGYRVSDTTAAEPIVALMKHKNRVIQIQRLLTPIEFSSLCSQCDFGIVTRMHAAILCTGSGYKPIIAINYLYKLREYMKNIGFENMSIDIDYINATDLKNFVDEMVLNYTEINRRLFSQINEMKRNLLNDIDSI